MSILWRVGWGGAWHVLLAMVWFKYYYLTDFYIYIYIVSEKKMARSYKKQNSENVTIDIILILFSFFLFRSGEDDGGGGGGNDIIFNNDNNNR